MCDNALGYLCVMILCCVQRYEFDVDYVLILLSRNCFMGLRSGQVHVVAEDLAEPTDEELDMFQCLLLLVNLSCLYKSSVY